MPCNQDRSPTASDVAYRSRLSAVSCLRSVARIAAPPASSASCSLSAEPSAVPVRGYLVRTAVARQSSSVSLIECGGERHAASLLLVVLLGHRLVDLLYLLERDQHLVEARRSVGFLLRQQLQHERRELVGHIGVICRWRGRLLPEVPAEQVVRSSCPRNGGRPGRQFEERASVAIDIERGSGKFAAGSARGS